MVTRIPATPPGSLMTSPSNWRAGTVPAPDGGHLPRCRECGRRGCRCDRDDPRDDTSRGEPGPLRFEEE